MSRTYKIKGTERFGIEISRNGSAVTLRAHEAAWPFPTTVTVDRTELVWMHGDPDPAPDLGREPAPEPALTDQQVAQQDSLFDVLPPGAPK